MVDIKIIEYIVGKCLTKARMKTKLAGLTQEEKNLELQGRLTRLEWDDYNNILNDYKKTYDKWMGLIEEGKIDKDKIPKIYEFLEDTYKEFYEDDLFNYERRIIEDYRVEDTNPPTINIDDYVYDEDVPYDINNMMDKNIIGSIEREMIDYQEQNYNLTDKETYWIERYYLDNYVPLKYRINHEFEALEERLCDDYEVANFNREFPSILKHMDNAINKQDGLLHPTILFHGGPVDISVPVGGHGVWKNYISATFQEISMKGHNRTNPDYWEVVIYAPTGTKGLCGNIRRPYGKDENGNIKWDDNMGMNQYLFEHEYLLGRNMGYTVIGMDYENHRQIVVLDEP